MSGEKIIINGLPLEAMSDAEIIQSEMPTVVVPSDMARNLSIYPEGTKRGFPCSICGTDCILAPSGQVIFAGGKNPLKCIRCMAAELEAEKADPN